MSRWLRSERGPNFSRCILAITNCRCSISACAPDELGARLDQRRLQRIGVVGKMISCPSHGGDTSTIALIRAINLRPESMSRSFIHRSACDQLRLR